MVVMRKAKQINMKKCGSCQSYFAEYLITSGKCRDCLNVPVAKQEIAEPKSSGENDKTSKEG